MIPAVDPSPPPAAASPGPDAGLPCYREARDSLCKKIYDWTGSDWLAQSSDWLITKPFRIAVILAAGFLVRWVVHRAIRRFLSREPAHSGGQPESGVTKRRRHQRAVTLGSLLESLSTVVIFVFVGLMALDELDFNIGPLIAGAGILGLAAGFGAQTLVKDFLSGMFMLLEDQYGVGDEVDLGIVDLEGTIGVVESVSLRITSIRDPDDVLWHVRNGEVLRVGNRSRRRRPSGNESGSSESGPGQD
ncbi:MAG TPA: mechanosensitive ion channel domain-containing protein [Sporichthya sp.]|nr:mechanosensitive ion channel domain-containing protein [Sporichthya sp.]